MVLRGDLHTAAYQVHDRLVATAVTELKLFHLSAAGQADHLVTKTNTKDRHLADQLLHLLVGLHHGVGSPGPLDKKTPSGFMSSTSLAGVSHGTTVRSQPARTRPSRMPRFTPQS